MANMRLYTTIFAVLSIIQCIIAAPASQATDQKNKLRTKVVILGGGVAGITAAQTLHEHGIDDFLIVEYNNEIGGRNRHTNFGSRADGSPYTIELGSNWVQEVTNNNPIWRLAEKYNISYSLQPLAVRTFNESGPLDTTETQKRFKKALGKAHHQATKMVRQNRLDQSELAGLMQNGWYPSTDPAGQAIEWNTLDFENGAPPIATSQIFDEATYPNTNSPGNGKVIKGDLYVHDQRGFNYFLRREAATFLKPNDPRLLLGTIVTNIKYDSNGVIVMTKGGKTIRAEHAICTFSLGVLQASIATTSSSSEHTDILDEDDLVTFSPPLPSWKQRAISNFGFATYTKLFMQFPNLKKFWPAHTPLCLYADPAVRGNYPLWQSLSLPNWLPDSGIIFATVVNPNSAQIEAQSDGTTKAQLLAILRNMFGKDKVPEPSAFMYPRWGRYPWARGSYSYWPVGVTMQDHENLRGTVDGRLWFAGEATSTENFGYLHGAWFEGHAAGVRIAEVLKDGGNSQCIDEAHYQHLEGNGQAAKYNRKNGFGVADVPEGALPDD